MIKVEVINLSKNSLPTYETKQSAGMDVRADFSRVSTENPIKLYGKGDYRFPQNVNEYKRSNGMLCLAPMSRAMIPTGLKIAVPEGYECQVRPRSGLALKKGLTVLNTPGTIDSDYRGEIGIVLINLSNEDVWIEDRERIAQLVFNKVEQAELIPAEVLVVTERGEGGFGHTGIK